MNQNLIITNWNSGNFEFIIENFNLHTLQGQFNVFFYIDSFYQLNQFDKVNELLEKYLQNKEITEQDLLMKNILVSRMFLAFGKYKEAELQLEDIQDDHPTIEDLFFYFVKILKASFLYLKNDFKKALETLSLLESEFKDIEHKFDYLNTSSFYSQKSLIEWKLGNKSIALSDITRSKSINMKFNNRIKIANDVLIRGQIYLDLGELLKTIMDYEEANKLYIEHNNQFGQKIVKLSIAEVKFIQGKLTDALSMFKQSLEDFEENDHQSCEIYLLIGKIYQKKRDYAQSLSNYENALEIAKKIQFPYYEALIILNIIDLLMETNQSSKIKKYELIFPKNDDTIIHSMKLMINALVNQNDDNFIKSKEIWIILSSDPNLPLHLQIYALENALKLSVLLWKNEKEINLLNDIQRIIEIWEKIATNNFLMSSLATIYLLKAKFYLAILQIIEAEHFLQEGIKLIDKFGLEVNRDDITNDKEKIAKFKQLKGTRELNENDISLDEMLDYLKNAKTNVLIQKS